MDQNRVFEPRDWYTVRIFDFGLYFIVRMDQNRIFEEFESGPKSQLYIPSRDYVLHTLFWPKKWTTEYMKYYGVTFKWNSGDLNIGQNGYGCSNKR